MHLNMIILSLILVALVLAIIILGAGVLTDVRRSKIKPPPVCPEAFEDPLEEIATTPKADEAPPKPLNVVPSSIPAPEVQADKIPDTPVLPTAKIAFNTIQSEIRAAFEAASQAPHPPQEIRSALLNWIEPGRLAVLSLGDVAPASAWQLLRAEGIRILIVQEDHPFPAPDKTIELLCLDDQETASLSSLITKLRARLAQGEPVAFHTESGLTGTAAFLAVRLSNRKPA